MSTSPKSSRQWPWFVLALAIIAAIVVVVMVKACPPVPAPAGKPAEGTGPTVVIEAKVDAPALAPTPIVVEVPAAKDGPK